MQIINIKKNSINCQFKVSYNKNINYIDLNQAERRI